MYRKYRNLKADFSLKCLSHATHTHTKKHDFVKFFFSRGGIQIRQDKNEKMANAVIKVQLNNIDSYQSAPTRLDTKTVAINGTKDYLSQVPVIRVFGRTDEGKVILVHIHGVFPYLYVKYEDDLESGKFVLQKKEKEKS